MQNTDKSCKTCETCETCGIDKCFAPRYCEANDYSNWQPIKLESEKSLEKSVEEYKNKIDNIYTDLKNAAYEYANIQIKDFDRLKDSFYDITEDFINGAKSQEAKNYWYNVFNNEIK